jgi:hypothetical protein
MRAVRRRGQASDGGSQQLGRSKSERAGEVMMKKKKAKQQQKRGSRLSAALRLSPRMDDNRVDE